jgi:hypothetical protein
MTFLTARLQDGLHVAMKGDSLSGQSQSAGEQNGNAHLNSL